MGRESLITQGEFDLDGTKANHDGHLDASTINRTGATDIVDESDQGDRYSLASFERLTGYSERIDHSNPDAMMRMWCAITEKAGGPHQFLRRPRRIPGIARHRGSGNLTGIPHADSGAADRIRQGIRLRPAGRTAVLSQSQRQRERDRRRAVRTSQHGDLQNLQGRGNPVHGPVQA